MPGILLYNCHRESELIFTTASRDRYIIILILRLRKLAQKSLLVKVRQQNLDLNSDLCLLWLLGALGKFRVAGRKVLISPPISSLKFNPSNLPLEVH